MINRVLRKLIKLGKHSGPIGTFGQFVGRRVGWRLKYGPRIIIDNPREYMQSEMLRRGAYEPEVARVLLASIHSGDIFFDIGANAGQHSLIAAHAGASVHAFEPLPRLAQRVRQNARLNGLLELIQVFEQAVSSQCGEVEIFEQPGEDDGSHSIIGTCKQNSSTAIRTPSTTIDEHIRVTGCRPNVLKIDVEGAECLVLDGAKDLLHAGPAQPIVIIETGDRLANESGESALSVLQRLLDEGYRVWEVPPDGRAEAEEVPRPVVWSGVRNYVAIPHDNERLPRILEAL